MDDELKDVERRIEKIPGFTSRTALVELMRLAGQVPNDQAIVELGVFHGRSLCHLALGSALGNGAHVWGVDPWDLPGERYPTGWLNQPGFTHRQTFTKTETRESAECHIRESGIGHMITTVRDFSTGYAERWDSGIEVGLLFVDGDHREAFVRADIEAWRGHLAHNAVVVFDDYDRVSHPDVPRVVDDYVRRGRLYDPRLVAGRMMVTHFKRTG